MDSVDERRFKALESKIKEEIPGFRVDFKDTTKDWKLRAAGKLVGIFNKKFMTSYITTLYPVVYFTNKEDLEENYEGYFYTLAHEWVHLYDRKVNGFWFTLSYLLPQVLAAFSLLAVGAIWNLWFLLALIFLLFLLPIRSPFRTEWELRGYSMSVATRVWDNFPVRDSYLERVVSNFTGMFYFRMCPDAEKVRKRLEEAKDSDLLLGKEGAVPFQVVKDLMEEITEK